MQYILMLYARESGWSELTQAQQEQAMGAYNAYTEALKNAGVLKGVNRLQSTSTATGAGWPVCGLERAAWRVLHHRCARSRCRDLVGSAVPGCKSRSRRGASALGQGGVRCP